MNKTNLLIYIFLIISFLGFVDATYLTAYHYSGKSVICLTNYNCQNVLNSKYSTFLSIPISLFGSIYYLTNFVIGISSIINKKRNMLFAAVISSLGFITSLYLTYLQIFVIKEICLYCIASAIFSTILLFLSIIIINILKHEK